MSGGRALLPTGRSASRVVLTPSIPAHRQPITLCIDGQAFLGRYVQYPEFLLSLMRYENDQLEDFLMRDPQPWFRSIVAAEIVLQLPFFFVAVYGLVAEKNWIRVPMVIYGSHVATTLVAILGEFLQAPLAEGYFSSEAARWTIIAVYLPYLIVPLLITVVFALDAAPFASGGKVKLG